mgnify:CR=1 FL=1
MRSLALFSVKGGVGKSALAVNLAHASATISGRRSLLWDLDPQGAATWTLRMAPKSGAKARKAIASGELSALIQPSTHANLDVLPADQSLRRLEAQLAGDDRTKRLKKLLKTLENDYDRIILDCPPGLTELADQVLRAVDMLVVPVVPSALSLRAFDQLRVHLDAEHKGHAPALLPVFSMADRRKALHREAMAGQPDWPVIPYAAAIERMAASQQPVLAGAPRSAAGQAIAALWAEVERRLLTP